MGGVMKGVGGAVGGLAGGLLGGVGQGGLLGGLASGMGKSNNKDAIIGLLNDDKGKPEYPGFKSMVDPSTGFLDPKYQLKNDLDTQALDKIQEQALSEGPSKWAQMAEAKGKSDAAAQSQGAIADAASRLSMKGGLSSGAQERLAMGGAANALKAQQDVGANIGLQDEQMKQAALASLPGMQIQKSQFGQGVNQYNIGNVLSQNQAEQNAALERYKNDMAAYGAKKSALATAMGGKKG